MRLPGRYTISLPHALLVSLTVVILVGVIVAGATSGSAFGLYNAQWNGGQAYRHLADQQATTVVATNTTGYEHVNPARTTAIILSPSNSYSKQDLSQVRQFVSNGGTLVVASDFGSGGNQILASLGLRMRFDGALVRDDDHHYRSSALPIATNIRRGSLTGNASRITLNYGTVLTRTTNATVLASTSEYSYLDTNRNGKLDSSETIKSRPIAAVTPLGSGRVIAVSDPSIFINRMLQRPGNRAFARGLLGTSTTVLFDNSHTTPIPPLQALRLWMTTTPLAIYALLVIITVGLASWTLGWTSPLVTHLRDRLQSNPTADPGLSHDEVESILARDHPDWSRDRIQRVAKRLSQSSRRTSGSQP